MPKKPFNKNKKSKSASLWRETLHDIDRLIGKKDLSQQLKDRKTKKQKMPMGMLKGVRNKRIKRYKEQNDKNSKGSVLFNSFDRKIDVDFYLKKKREERRKNLKSEEFKYNYKGAEKKKVGKYKDGMLVLSKFDLKKLNS